MEFQRTPGWLAPTLMTEHTSANSIAQPPPKRMDRQHFQSHGVYIRFSNKRYD